jgi:hypothetical protein
MEQQKETYEPWQQQWLLQVGAMAIYFPSDIPIGPPRIAAQNVQFDAPAPKPRQISIVAAEGQKVSIFHQEQETSTLSALYIHEPMQRFLCEKKGQPVQPGRSKIVTTK